jgi:hypothetical protein
VSVLLLAFSAVTVNENPVPAEALDTVLTLKWVPDAGLTTTEALPVVVLEVVSVAEMVWLRVWSHSCARYAAFSGIGLSFAT